jgi:hypothetical protein
MEIFFKKFYKVIHELMFIFKQNAKVQKNSVKVGK